MLRFTFRNYLLELLNEPTYSFASTDNPRTYQHEYLLDDGEFRPSSCHGVRVIDGDGVVVTSCVLAASGGATGVNDNSALVRRDSLIIAVGPFVASLQLPSLALNWTLQSDEITCFGVYHSAMCGCYISHGELMVTRVSYEGEIVWSRGGRDILTGDCTVLEGRVEVADFNDDVYAWAIDTGDTVPVDPSRR